MSHIIVPEKNTTFKNAIIFLGRFDQLQIFLQLYLIQSLGLLTGLVLLDLRHFIYPRLLTGFYMLVFLYKLKSCEISGQKFGLFRLENFRFFSVIDGFKWFWMGTLRKNIYKIWEFLKAPFFFVLFPHYKLLTSLMILFVILLSMLMILLSILSVIRNLIFGND